MFEETTTKNFPKIIRNSSNKSKSSKTPKQKNIKQINSKTAKNQRKTQSRGEKTLQKKEDKNNSRY